MLGRWNLLQHIWGCLWYPRWCSVLPEIFIVCPSWNLTRYVKGSLLDHNSVFNIVTICCVVFHSICTIFPLRVPKCSNFFTVSQTCVILPLCHFLFWGSNCLNVYEVEIALLFLLIFLYQWWQAFFHVLISYQYIFLGKMSFPLSILKSN